MPADGSGSKNFSNLSMLGFVVIIPYLIIRVIGASIKTWFFFLAITVIPTMMTYWTILSAHSPRLNEKVKYPNRPILHYLEFHKPEL